MTLVLFQLGFETFEQGECIGRRTGESDQDLVVVDFSHFFCVPLHYGVSQRNLTVTGQCYLAVSFYRNNCCSIHRHIVYPVCA